MTETFLSWITEYSYTLALEYVQQSQLSNQTSFTLPHVVPLLCDDREKEHALLGSARQPPITAI
jgi:hypothetical protein